MFRDDLPTDYLACVDCEDVFKRDEDYMLTVMVQPDGSFPWFQDAMVPNGPIVARYALGVILRFVASRYAEGATLGRYRDPVAKHVLGLQPIPERVQVVAVLSDTLKTVARPPASVRLGGYRVYPFWVCGVGLHVMVGDVPDVFVQSCLARGGRAARDRDDRVAQPLMEQVARARPVKAAADWLTMR